jgi:hypothetical protein
MGKVLHSVFLMLVLSLPIAGCSTQDVPNTAVPSVIRGKVYKGLVQSTTVTAYELLPDRTKGKILASDVTDLAEDTERADYEPGTFELRILNYRGPVLIEASGQESVFVDEASGKEVHFGPDDSLSLLLPDVQPGAAVTGYITPLTEFAKRLAFCPANTQRDLTDAHQLALESVQDLFGVRDITALEPASLHAEEATDDKRADKNYAFALAALSQDALHRTGAGAVMELVKKIATDFDDCEADGTAKGKPIRIGATTLPTEYYSTDLANAAVAYAVAAGIEPQLGLTYASLLTKRPTILSGSVTLGPVANTAVKATGLNEDGTLGKVLGTTATKADGTFSLAIAPYWGTIVLSTSGGAYVEEANGSVVTLSPRDQLHTILPLVELSQEINSVAVSPLSEWAYRRFSCSAGETLQKRWTTSTNNITNLFGIPDFTQTRPIDLTAVLNGHSSEKGIRHGLLVATISQLADRLTNLGVQPHGVSSYDLVKAIGEDFSDCVLDGKADGNDLRLGAYRYNETTLRKDLVSSAATFVDGSKNASGLFYADVKGAVSALGGDVAGTVAGQVHKGLASGYEVIAQDWRGWLNQGEVASTGAVGDMYSLEIFGFYGPLKLTAQGAAAVYLDEELQTDVPFGSNRLTALIENFRNGERLHYIISPLSDFAFTLAACYVRKGIASEDQALTQANAVIGAHFGVEDFYTIAPKDLSSGGYAGAVSDSDRFAMALAGLSRLAQDINQKSGLGESAYVSSIDLTAKLSSDLANDCMWDGVGAGNQPLSVGAYQFGPGTLRIELAEAVASWMRSGKNQSGIPSSEAHDYGRFLSENASTLFASPPGILFDNQGPTLTANIPHGAWVKGVITLHVTATDETGVEYLDVTSPTTIAGLNDNLPAPTELKIVIATDVLDDGPLDLWLQSEDGIGNQTLLHYRLNIDNTEPTLQSVGGPRTRLPTGILEGIWSAPSGITWFTAQHASSLETYHIDVAEDGTFRAGVSLPVEGPNTFQLRAVNGVNTAAEMSVAITKDTRGPEVLLLSGVHHGYQGDQPYDDSKLRAGDFRFETRYPSPITAFEYPDTRFEFAVTDTSGSVSVVTKKLLKNGVLVRPASGNLSHLGISTFGNDLHRSISSGATPTRWTIRITAVDDLGNINQKDYSFGVRIHAPLQVTGFRKGDECGITNGAYLRDYDFNCSGHMSSGGYNRADWLEGGAPAGYWVGGKLSIMMVQFTNEATDISVTFNPAAFQSDFNKSFYVRETVYSDWDFWYDSDTLNGAANGCSTVPYRDPAYDWQGTFVGCKNWSAYAREALVSKPTAIATVSYIITDNGNSTLPAGTTYVIPPGQTRRFYLQITSPLPGMQLVNRLCKDVGAGNDGHSYWGHRQYLWRDLVYTNGTNVWSYKRYETCNVSHSISVSYAGGATGQPMRALVATEFEPGLSVEYSSNIALPYFNNLKMSLAAD